MAIVVQILFFFICFSHCVVKVCPDVLEEYATSIFREVECGSGGC
jgi:hypothetical protein